mmetsp:Transcript_34774/g.99889  ORF Transcript_34774/g.99889 Transcript_34774/m.99889 type:complete len:287 (-) Transcript_34774:469-1329(-)
MPFTMRCMAFCCLRLSAAERGLPSSLRRETCMRRSSSEMQSATRAWATPRHLPQKRKLQRRHSATGASSSDAGFSAIVGASIPFSSHAGQKTTFSSVELITCWIFKRSHRSYASSSSTRSSVPAAISARQSGCGHRSSRMLPSATWSLAISVTHSEQKAWAQPPRCTNCEPGRSEKQIWQQWTCWRQSSCSLRWSYCTSSRREATGSVHSATARMSVASCEEDKVTEPLSPSSEAVSLRRSSAQVKTTGRPCISAARASSSAQSCSRCLASSQEHSRWNCGSVTSG